MTDIENRVAKLERENRLMKIGGLFQSQFLELVS